MQVPQAVAVATCILLLLLHLMCRSHRWVPPLSSCRAIVPCREGREPEGSLCAGRVLCVERVECQRSGKILCGREVCAGRGAPRVMRLQDGVSRYAAQRRRRVSLDRGMCRELGVLSFGVCLELWRGRLVPPVVKDLFVCLIGRASACVSCRGGLPRRSGLVSGIAHEQTHH
jgi:hypothetical protein